MNFKRSYLSTALAAALVAGGVPGSVSAVTLSQDNIGDAGIVPYYTMRDGWATDFYIINTSKSTIAAKVRFHESRNSREVLDFIVVLSPRDMINAYAYVGADGKPVVKFPPLNGEGSCVVPIPEGGVAGGVLPFSDEAIAAKPDGYPNFGAGDPLENAGLDRALEGYFTVIEMGSSSSGAVHDASLHNPEPDCAAIETAFRPTDSGGTVIDTYNEFERNLNALKVGFSYTNAARGVQGAGSATMLSNFATWDSWLAHTKTSILAGGGEVAQLSAELAVLDEAREAAYLAAVHALDVADGQTGCTAPAAPARYDDFPVLPDPDCTANLDTVNAYDSAVTAYNSARVDYNDKDAELTAATAAQLGPPRNLIYPQATLLEPDAHAPNLNNGDFIAHWIVDGEYEDDGTAYDTRPPGFNPPFNTWFGFYPRPVDAVTALLMKADAINEWAYNANTGATSDIILTAPTKRFYTDWADVYANEPHLEGIAPLLGLAVRTVPFGFPPFSDQFVNGVSHGRSCDPVNVGFWNNDELGPINPTVLSPAGQKQLCWETNVLYTGPDSLFASKVGVQLDVRALLNTNVESETYNGWLMVHMANQPSQYHPAIPLLNITLPNLPPQVPAEVVQVGMPYIGFAFKQRDLGDPTKAYGGLTPHSYRRLWEVRNFVGGEFTPDNLIPADSFPVNPNLNN
jgi:hypothetical protein